MTSCADSRLHALIQVYHLSKHKSDTKYVFFLSCLVLFVCLFVLIRVDMSLQTMK